MSAAELAARKKLNLEKATNFMRQFRDPETRDLKKLSANQFMDVWNNYDKDGNIIFCLQILVNNFVTFKYLYWNKKLI